MKKQHLISVVLIGVGAWLTCSSFTTSSSEVEEPTTTTATTNSENKDGDTSKDTGTTDNKETGVEDYFIALGTIGIAVTALLYVVDKKNVFKKI